MKWRIANCCDQQGRRLADRHYSRQRPGSARFVPPGRATVLVTTCGRAVWATSWPFAEYVRHAWAGAWICSIFRNEGAGRSSDLIRDAVAVTRHRWQPPELGIVTFVDPGKVRRKRDPGRCFRRAGFRHVGETQGGLLAFQMLPDEMPPAIRAVEIQPSLIGGGA